MTGASSDQVLAQAQQIAALTADRHHYKRESEIGGAMLTAIIDGLNLPADRTGAGSSAQDIVNHVTALTDEVAQLRIAHDRADGALADAETVPTGDLERGIRLLTAERDVIAGSRTRALSAIAEWANRARTAEADVKALAEALVGLMQWGVELDDERLHYVSVQVERADIARARAALARPGVVRVREEETG